MKKIVTLLIFMMFSVVTFSQYGVNVSMENFKQTNETEVSWEIWMTATIDPFPLLAVSMQWEFNNDILNNGIFRNVDFTVEQGSDYEGELDIFFSANVEGTLPGLYLDWFPFTIDIPVNTLLTEINNTPKHIATFNLQLTKDGNPHNFADIAHELAFRSGGDIGIRRPETFDANNEYDGSTTILVPHTLTPAAGTPINDRQLAGYWFEGDGDWDNTSLWNNVTVENANTTPSPNANAIINGNVIIPDGLEVSLEPDVNGNGGEVTVLTGEEGLYTITLLPNGTGVTVTLFDDEYNVIAGASQSDVAVGTLFAINTTGIGPSGSFISWTDQDGTVISTDQYFEWYSMPGNDVTITANWTSGSPPKNTPLKSGMLSSLTIAPNASLTVDKLFNDHENGAEAIVIKSDDTGTGSLILNNEGVLATVESFIPESTDWNKSPNPANWYWISSPVEEQDIGDFLAILDGFSDYDLYRWGEVEDLWYNYKDPISGNFAHTEFQRGYGYLFAAQVDETYTYAGPLNVGDETWGTLSKRGNGGGEPGDPLAFDNGWHLIGNPYSSGIQYNDGGWIANHVSYTPQYWDDGAYKAYLDGEIIPPMTAFFVQADEDGASLTIPQTVRAHFDNSKTLNENYIILTAEPKEGNTRQFTYIRYAPQAVEGYDYRYDSRFRLGDAPAFFSKMDEEFLLVQAINEVHGDVTIPLGFLRNNEGYDFQISLESTISDMHPYLYDSKLDIEHQLTADAPYSFQAFDDDDLMRFELRFSPGGTDPTGIDEAEDKLARTWTYNNTLYIHTNQQHTQAGLYDLSGRKLYHFNIQTTGQHTYNLNLPAGVYLIRLSDNVETQTNRVIIK